METSFWEKTAKIRKTRKEKREKEDTRRKTKKDKIKKGKSIKNTGSWSWPSVYVQRKLFIRKWIDQKELKSYKKDQVQHVHEWSELINAESSSSESIGQNDESSESSDDEEDLCHLCCHKYQSSIGKRVKRFSCIFFDKYQHWMHSISERSSA